MSGLEDMGYDSDSVTRKLAAFSRTFHDTYAAGKGASKGWLDKSPAYAEEPNSIVSAYPDARFIIMHRNPLDQIHSFTRGGTFSHPTLPAVAPGLELIQAAAKYWTEVTRGLLDFERIYRAQCLSIRYEVLCERPEETLRRIADHLNLPWSEDMLHYHRFPHDLGREAGRASGTKGFSISTGSWRSWPEAWIHSAWTLTGTTAEGLGYRENQ